jgi:peptidyl-prolyl cis-trans isomerase C
MVAEFDTAAFEAEIGQVVGPVKTQFGYHLIKVEQKTEASVVAFEEVAENIKNNLFQQKQNEAYAAKVNELRAKYMQ